MHSEQLLKTFLFQLSFQLMYKSGVALFFSFWLGPSWNHNYHSIYLGLQRFWLWNFYVLFVFSCFAARLPICLCETPSSIPLLVMIWNATIARCWCNVTGTEKETLNFNIVKATQITIREYTTNKSERWCCPKFTESELHFWPVTSVKKCTIM